MHVIIKNVAIEDDYHVSKYDRSNATEYGRTDIFLVQWFGQHYCINVFIFPSGRHVAQGYGYRLFKKDKDKIDAVVKKVLEDNKTFVSAQSKVRN